MNKEIVKRLKDSLDYEFDLSFSDRKQLLSYIEQLEEELKQEKKDYKETNDKCFELINENKQLENNRDKALKIIDSYELGKYDYSIPPGGIIELRDALKGDSDEQE